MSDLHRLGARLLTTRTGSSGAPNDGFSRRNRCAVVRRTDRPYRSGILRVRVVWTLRILALDVRSRCAAFARGISTLRSRGETVTSVTIPPASYPVQFAVFLLVTDAYSPSSLAA